MGMTTAGKARTGLYIASFGAAAVGSATGLADIWGIDDWRVTAGLIVPALVAEGGGYVLITGARERVTVSEKPWFQVALANVIAGIAIALQIMGHAPREAVPFVFFSVLAWIIVLIEFAEHVRDWRVLHAEEIIRLQLQEANGETELSRMRAELAEKERVERAAAAAARIARERMRAEFGDDRAELMSKLLDFPRLVARAQGDAEARSGEIADWLVEIGTMPMRETAVRPVPAPVVVEAVRAVEETEVEEVVETETTTRTTRRTSSRGLTEVQRGRALELIAAGELNATRIAREIEAGNRNQVARMPEFLEAIQKAR